MNIIETRTKYIYARECDKRVNKKNKKRYEIGKGITAEFYKKHNSNRYDLCNICFDKKEYELMKADMLWSDVDVRLVTKQFDWNRKFPPVFFVREFPGGFFVIAFLRGQKKVGFPQKAGRGYRRSDGIYGRGYIRCVPGGNRRQRLRGRRTGKSSVAHVL